MTGTGAKARLRRGRVTLELALQPASSVQARMPPTARQRREERGALVATAGPVHYIWGAAHRLAVASPPRVIARRVYFLPSGRIPARDGRLRTMMNIKRDSATCRRGEVTRDSTGRRLSPTINAQRRPKAPRPASALSASRVARGDPRYAYLAEPHD